MLASEMNKREKILLDINEFIENPSTGSAEERLELILRRTVPFFVKNNYIFSHSKTYQVKRQ